MGAGGRGFKSRLPDRKRLVDIGRRRDRRQRPTIRHQSTQMLTGRADIPLARATAAVIRSWTCSRASGSTSPRRTRHLAATLGQLESVHQRVTVPPGHPPAAAERRPSAGVLPRIECHQSRGSWWSANAAPSRAGLEEFLAVHPELVPELSGTGPCVPLNTDGEVIEENIDAFLEIIAAYEAEQQRRCDAVPQCRDRRGCPRRLRRRRGGPLIRFELPRRGWTGESSRTHLASRRGPTRTRGRHRLLLRRVINRTRTLTHQRTPPSAPPGRNRTDSANSQPRSSTQNCRYRAPSVTRLRRKPAAHHRRPGRGIASAVPRGFV